MGSNQLAELLLSENGLIVQSCNGQCEVAIWNSSFVPLKANGAQDARITLYVELWSWKSLKVGCEYLKLLTILIFSHFWLHYPRCLFMQTIFSIAS